METTVNHGNQLPVLHETTLLSTALIPPLPLLAYSYCNEMVAFTPEQLVAMIIVDMKKIAEAESGIPVTDCCLSVPTYYTEAERYAMLDAATIAGVNCLRLVNETTAAALSYGIYKTDLPETDPVYVAFVDVGHSSTQVRG